ncbi:MAG: hypothetical protein A3C79_02820 [Candidatus Taylorbacteria bacterium RIFCSPHIGHO2_02_FULL_45_28]|uniref:Uncharacterized protein n=1 Tax=Candidatus Taylorbacteria bacterium RIFCSPHIGHO2_12_FULL_45_16 TaxID=1802315 RepID=A0A1G2N0V0_9BACT|nr:MAG: hypothetical protein A2830_00540 [Candidatus Taylorbacteria bacterium RIFCSPHIGHO2_01_FULL_44_110]OHA24896.1 MAG: hypothetical protein A3C79_02820 [Candidatus Taylorbacteria bacterium RIFCSPHIGHO2_02_FULL_45_28]OHA29714.1 MAG: hypothetical protein A3F51_03235 [Candidatus Taylorbacteria bacterium RIFCSPHIGHO2_12_FULL_45_16]OHA32658.1 MAG: hypothetical protein A3A23_00105 [Candidatus Taylorbacteria bacterium RIFCSPLOWO2_01_FULL_45_59]OHA38811.1 MAG: hypothetical protein A3I98_01540 [Candi
MPSLFPYLFTYEQIAPLILRLILGITLAYFGYKKMRQRGKSSGSNSTIYGAVEILVALFLIIGLFTQLAALINVIILVIKIGYKIRDRAFLTDGINYYLLLLIIAIAVIFLGSGWFAFDLPL